MPALRNVTGAIVEDLRVIYGTDEINGVLGVVATCYLFIRSMFIDRDFRAVTTHRLKRYAYLRDNKLLLKIARGVDMLINGVEISERAEIGSNLQMPHAHCIVIGGDAVIGNNVSIYQGVTLGQTWNKERGGRMYPIIRDNVRIGAGAKVIGPVTIGENSVIGANAVVLNDIPENSVAVGIPAKVVKRVLQ